MAKQLDKTILRLQIVPSPYKFIEQNHLIKKLLWAAFLAQLSSPISYMGIVRHAFRHCRKSKVNPVQDS